MFAYKQAFREHLPLQKRKLVAICMIGKCYLVKTVWYKGRSVAYEGRAG